MAFILAFIAAFTFSPFSLPFQPSEEKTYTDKPNPYSEGWWVCAYCGKKYEDNVSRCDCHPPW